jgi:group I intron endonuclease
MEDENMSKKQKLIGKSGVYGWFVDGIIRYVGSAGNFESRKSNPLSNLRKGKHCNKRLQALFNEVGEDRFELVILEKCAKRDLYVLEKKYKDMYRDTVFNENNIIKLTKKIRRGKEAANHKEKFRQLFSGERNPNVKITESQAGEILWLKLHTNLKHKEIGDMYGVSTSQVSRIGKIRWVDVKPVEPINFNINKENESIKEQIILPIRNFDNGNELHI